jgi:hypothetical protein
MSDRSLTTPEDRALMAEWDARLTGLGRLHRYVSIRGERFAWFYDLALRSLLYFPGYRDLNDPFDGRVRLNDEGTEVEKREFWEGFQVRNGRVLDATAKAEIDHILAQSPADHRRRLWDAHEEETNKLGVACFSEDDDYIPMWSYYADSHRGLCLRFRESLLRGWGDSLPPMRVVYEDDYPDAYFYRDSMFKRMQATVATKSRVWSHENEWRIIRSARGEVVQFDPTALEAIIMGCEMPPEDEARVRDVCARRTPHVKLLKAHMAERAFKLDILPA